MFLLPYICIFSVFDLWELIFVSFAQKRQSKNQMLVKSVRCESDTLIKKYEQESFIAPDPEFRLPN